MPYKDPSSPEAIASNKKRQQRQNARRRELREAYLQEHPELRPKIITPESDNERRLREKEKKKTYKKPKDFRDRNFSSNLKRRFGITLDQRNAKIKLQRGLCTLCSRPLDQEGLGGPAIDHNHVTNGLRDIIHRTCNAAIGLLNDDPILLRKAAEYLERFQ